MRVIYELDQRTIADLKALAGEDDPFFFQTQADLFMQRGQSLMTSLDAALSEDDLRQLGQVAHALAGSASVIGAVGLRDLCWQLEAACRESRAAALFELCYRIHAAFHEADRLLKRECVGYELEL